VSSPDLAVAQTNTTEPRLPREHPAAVAFLDEAGTISVDRFFAIGMLKLREPSIVLRELDRLRQKRRFFEELHWKELTGSNYAFYREALELVIGSDARFACFVADRHANDPVTRFGNQWTAYERLAEQLLVGNIRRPELVTVLADNYSTPKGVLFEQDVKKQVNRRLRRLAVPTVCRLDSRSTDGLQLVDLLLGAILFEFKQAVGDASSTSRKARLAGEVRALYGISSCVPQGCKRSPRLNVAVYSHQLVKTP